MVLSVSKLQLSKFLWVATFCALIVGCANPINAKTTSRYYEQGLAAEKNGDLLSAREAYKRAYINTQIGNLGDKSSAYALYEWSRITGYLKIYDEAEDGFRKTLTHIDNAAPVANQLRPPALSELARLLNNTNQHEKAIPVFRQALDALNDVNTLEIDPIGFSEFLEMYAQSLEELGDEKYLDVLNEVKNIRSKHPNTKAKYVPRDY